MRESEQERVVIHAKSLQELRDKVDEATRARIVTSLDESTYTEKDGTLVHRAIIVRSLKCHLTE